LASEHRFFPERLLHRKPKLNNINVVSEVKVQKYAKYASSLEMFKARLGSPTWWLATLSMAGGRNRMIFKVPSNPSHGG